jgi:hypothetical protein
MIASISATFCSATWNCFSRIWFKGCSDLVHPRNKAMEARNRNVFLKGNVIAFLLAVIRIRIDP